MTTFLMSTKCIPLQKQSAGQNLLVLSFFSRWFFLSFIIVVLSFQNTISSCFGRWDITKSLNFLVSVYSLLQSYVFRQFCPFFYSIPPVKHNIRNITHNITSVYYGESRVSETSCNHSKNIIFTAMQSFSPTVVFLYKC